MPNWCDNHLTITGAPDAVRAACALLSPGGAPGNDPGAGAAQAGALVRPPRLARATEPRLWRPTGTELATTARPHEPNDRVRPEQATATCSFESPWSPPVEWLCAVSGASPAVRLDLRYYVDDVPCARWATFVAGAWEGDEYRDDERMHDVVARMSAGPR